MILSKPSNITHSEVETILSTINMVAACNSLTQIVGHLAGLGSVVKFSFSLSKKLLIQLN